MEIMNDRATQTNRKTNTTNHYSKYIARASLKRTTHIYTHTFEYTQCVMFNYLFYKKLALSVKFICYVNSFIYINYAPRYIHTTVPVYYMIEKSSCNYFIMKTFLTFFLLPFSSYFRITLRVGECI